MPYFDLDCLADTSKGDFSQPLRLNPHEWALITSPNLHMITVGGDTVRSLESEYPLEAIQALVSHCSPSLKEVSYVHRRKLNAPQWQSQMPFPGIALPSTLKHGSASKKSLTSLSIEYVPDPKLGQWQDCINYDTLQKLTLNTIDAEVLAWAATDLHLPALKHLQINTIFGQPVDSAVTFLQSLPSLTTLVIGSEKVSDVTFNTILHHHGSTLQRLALPYYSCSLSDLRALRKICLELVDINVEIQRTQGDSAELALYECLGSFSCLQYLTLHLDCSIRLSEADLRADPRYRPDDRDKSLHLDHTKQSFINCAVDRTLAAFIFSRISVAQLPSAPTLKHAILYVIQAGTIHAPDRSYSCRSRLEVHGQFQRIWTCRTDPRDDRKGEVIAEEAQSSRREGEREDAARNGRFPELSGLEPAFRELWPEEKGNDWREDWSSFPLQESDVQAL